MPSPSDRTRTLADPRSADALDTESAPGQSDAPTGDLVALDRAQRGEIEVLVVDDERSLREGCASLLRGEGYSVTVEGDAEAAINLIRARHFDILLFDLYMPEITGMDLLAVAREAIPDGLVILMTGNPTVETSIEALRRGAWDYLPKPFSAQQFQILLGRAAHTVAVAKESRVLDQDAGEAEDDPAVESKSASFRKVMDMAARVARTDASVFLTGESGAGKEVLARYIHEHSRRRSRPLIPVNCAAIPEALVESEMFGHVKGAFTGAVRDKEGLLEAANGGTLFLDELTELPMPTQAKLLRVLQDGVVRRVGSVKPDAVVNVRFIAATNRDPIESIRDGTLRKDLHYRLRVVPLHVPPLRERREDIPTLARSFLKEFWERHRDPGSTQPTFSDEAILALQRAPFAGNVRELRNIIEHLVVLMDPGASVQPGDLPLHDDFEADGDAFGGSPFASVMSLGYHDAREKILAEFEVRYLQHVVEAAGGNISDAARIAGVDRTTLYRLMDKHGTDASSLNDSGGSGGA